MSKIDRRGKIYLCVKSLFNISNDLQEDFEEYSNIILHIADTIARKMEEELKSTEEYKIYDGENCHDLKYGENCKSDCKCGGDKVVTSPDIAAMDEIINEAIKEVRKELTESAGSLCNEKK